jgi:hypothetical protein
MSKTAKAILRAALCPASAMLLLCACETTAPIQDSGDTAIGSKSAANVEATQFTPAETAEMKKAAEKFLNEILTGLRDRNYKLFIKNFTDEMKVDIPEKSFQVMCTEFAMKKGPYIARQYLGDLTQGYFKIFLWKAQFEVPKELVAEAKKAGRDPKTLLRGDTLIRLEVAKINNNYVVMGIYFQ